MSLIYGRRKRDDRIVGWEYIGHKSTSMLDGEAILLIICPTLSQI